MSAKTKQNSATGTPEPAVAGTLVLASTSRYRRELLERLRLPFSVAAPDVDETPLPRERPRDTALRLSESKARSIAARFPHAFIIGSDQVADRNGEPIGKPTSTQHARELLLRLSGQSVVFHTGVALLDPESGKCQTALVDVRSTFRELTREQIDAYIAREAALDCAAGVKVEALGIALFSAIESDDPTALIGLPLIRLIDMLHNAGIRPLG